VSDATENPIEKTPSSDDDSGPPANSLLSAMAGEYFGTFVLVFFGVGSVNAAVATGAQAGLWQVAVVWAVGVSLGIYTAASLSGAQPSMIPSTWVGTRGGATREHVRHLGGHTGRSGAWAALSTFFWCRVKIAWYGMKPRPNQADWQRPQSRT